MQIACKRFGCQKAVEVCYWTCKYRKKCKDWTGALDGQPGLVAITDRLQTAASKTGRIFDAKSLIKPVRIKRVAPRSVRPAQVADSEANFATLKMAHSVTKSIPQVVPPAAKAATNGSQHKLRQVKLAIKQTKAERKVMPKSEDDNIEYKAEIQTPKANGTKPAPKPAAKPKMPTTGTVYLLLGKNGKYRELREADLLKEAAHIIKDPSLRLVKGNYLVPQITFKSLDE